VPPGSLIPASEDISLPIDLSIWCASRCTPTQFNYLTYSLSRIVATNMGNQARAEEIEWNWEKRVGHCKATMMPSRLRKVIWREKDDLVGSTFNDLFYLVPEENKAVLATHQQKRRQMYNSWCAW
jgi:hypothetical protein